MRAKVELNQAEKQMVLNAMKTFQLRLKGAELKLFQIAFRRIEEAKGNAIYLDGMENSYVVQALNRRAKLLWAVNKRQESELYRELAKKIETIRMLFQYNFSMAIKKAACDPNPTQTA